MAVNTFIDRLLSVLHNNKMNYYNISEEFNSFKYFKDTFLSVESYYNNYELNKSLLCKIHNILNKDSNKFNIKSDNTFNNSHKNIIEELSIKKVKKIFFFKSYLLSLSKF